MILTEGLSDCKGKATCPRRRTSSRLAEDGASKVLTIPSSDLSLTGRGRGGGSILSVSSGLDMEGALAGLMIVNDGWVAFSGNASGLNCPMFSGLDREGALVGLMIVDGGWIAFSGNTDGPACPISSRLDMKRALVDSMTPALALADRGAIGPSG